MRRISITIDDDLYEMMEKTLAKLGEVNRSRFITSALNNYLSEVMIPEEGQVFSLVVIIFNHEVGEVDKEITSVQHDYRDIIKVTTHIHLTEDLCAEVIHIVGDSRRVREIVNRLSKIERGVKYLRVLTSIVLNT